METYNHSRKCLKCGGGDTADSYHGDGLCKFGSRKCAGNPIGEHIARHCRCCHFEWPEACLSVKSQEIGISDAIDRAKDCDICGCALVFIRGRHPKQDRREVCPTCAVERLEQIREMASPDYGQVDCGLAESERY